MATFNEILPAYSLADLFRDINRGFINTFQYDNEKFTIISCGAKWIIKQDSTELKAVAPYCGCMLDLQGMAACLISYKKDLTFNRAGDII